jgi:hypothetical protein
VFPLFTGLPERLFNFQALDFTMFRSSSTSSIGAPDVLIRCHLNGHAATTNIDQRKVTDAAKMSRPYSNALETTPIAFGVEF